MTYRYSSCDQPDFSCEKLVGQWTCWTNDWPIDVSNWRDLEKFPKKTNRWVWVECFWGTFVSKWYELSKWHLKVHIGCQNVFRFMSHQFIWRNVGSRDESDPLVRQSTVSIQSGMQRDEYKRTGQDGIGLSDCDSRKTHCICEGNSRQTT